MSYTFEILNERAKELCEHFGYTHLVSRINTNPNGYKEYLGNMTQKLQVVKGEMKMKMS